MLLVSVKYELWSNNKWKNFIHIKKKWKNFGLNSQKSNGPQGHFLELKKKSKAADFSYLKPQKPGDKQKVHILTILESQNQLKMLVPA